MVQRAFRLDFGPTWEQETDGIFIYCIVNLFHDLRSKPSYREKDGCADAEEFIR